MGTDDNKKVEFAQRDKELRARIFDSLFTRLTWLDAAAIAAIALYVPIQRAWSSFDTEKLDNVGWFLQRSAIAFAILGVGLIAVGVFLI